MKATVHKITLYVCDLENNLTVSDLEQMISQDVLDRVSTNGFCHLSLVSEKEIDWDDDVPLNKISLNRKDETWEAVFDDMQAKINALNSISPTDWSVSCGELEYICADSTMANIKTLYLGGFSFEEIDNAIEDADTGIDLANLAFQVCGAEWWSPETGFTLKADNKT